MDNAIKNVEVTRPFKDGGFDAVGNYVLPGSGHFVQGWMANNGVINTSGAVSDIKIGNIDKETKFYLESRGLTEDEINSLFVKSIILGKMELDEEASLFNEKIKEWW